MSSEVLNLRGHNKQRDFLKREIQNRTLKSPIILHGTDGIGKSLVIKEALELYKAQKIHIDCTEFKPESKLSTYTLDEIHAFTQEVKIKPFANTLRVFIFDDAHKFLPVHANALLKTLEELDISVLVFFITHNIKEVLATIRSRCFQLYFEPLTNELVCHILNQTLQEHILKQALGSISRAKLLLNSEFMQAKSAFLQAISAIYAKRFDQLSILLDQIQKIVTQNSRDWIEYLFEVLLYFQMDRVRFKYKIQTYMFPENERLYQKLDTQPYLNLECLHVKIQSLRDSYHIGISGKYVLEQALLAMLV